MKDYFINTKPKQLAVDNTTLIPEVEEVWDEVVANIAPRAVEVYFEGSLDGSKMTVKSESSLLALIHACHESREAELKHFERLNIGTLSTKAVIDWSADILFVNANFPRPTIEAALRDANFLSKCRRIALDNEFFHQYVATPNSASGLRRLDFESFYQFRQLEKVLVLVEPERGRGPESTRKYEKSRFVTAEKAFKQTSNLLHYFLAFNSNFNSGSLVALMNNDEYDVLREHKTPHVHADAAISTILVHRSTNLPMADGTHPEERPLTQWETRRIPGTRLESFSRRCADTREMLDALEKFDSAWQIVPSVLAAVFRDKGNCI